VICFLYDVITPSSMVFYNDEILTILLDLVIKYTLAFCCDLILWTNLDKWLLLWFNLCCPRGRMLD